MDLSHSFAHRRPTTALPPRVIRSSGPQEFRIYNDTNWNALLTGMRESLPIKDLMHALWTNPERRWVKLLPASKHGPLALRFVGVGMK